MPKCYATWDYGVFLNHNFRRHDSSARLPARLYEVGTKLETLLARYVRSLLKTETQPPRSGTSPLHEESIFLSQIPRGHLDSRSPSKQAQRHAEVYSLPGPYISFKPDMPCYLPVHLLIDNALWDDHFSLM